MDCSPSQSSTGFSRYKLFARLNELTGVSETEIVSNFREREVVVARFALMLFLRKRGWSMPQIGKFMNRDHTTVMSGLKVARGYYESRPDFRTLVDSLCA